MKFIIVPIFIILITVQSFSKWILIIEFDIYRNYIAKNLCENRYRPQLHCNGKCLLMKKMAAEENQSSPAGTLKLNTETFLFFDNHTEYSGKNFCSASESFTHINSQFLSQIFVTDVFHPPLA